jgi:hypothetical protein
VVATDGTSGWPRAYALVTMAIAAGARVARERLGRQSFEDTFPASKELTDAQKSCFRIVLLLPRHTGVGEWTSMLDSSR